MADAAKRDEALVDLADALGLPRPPSRIECYDMSNIQGASAVGSMVVFIDGRPEPREYRRFRIRSGDTPDDFRMMAEVLRRRFSRVAKLRASTGALSLAAVGADEAPQGDATNDEPIDIDPQAGPVSPEDGAVPREPGWAVPDLVIVDGGKGQLSAAVGALGDLGINDLPITGLAKRFEELHLPGRAAPVVLPRRSQALYLVQRIRDEAHRFAITYHREVRGRSALRSELDEIAGVGPGRKRALLKRFGSVRRIREASVDEVASVRGISRTLAETIKAHLAREGMLA
jgi:excinuclease ABC subunit C